jgi:hypothetical protein
MFRGDNGLPLDDKRVRGNPDAWDAHKQAQKLRETSTVQTVAIVISPEHKLLAQKGHTLNL